MLIRLLYYLPIERMSKENKIHLEGAKVYGPQDYEVVDELKKLKEENKNLRDYADNLDSENDNQAIEIEELKKENKELQEALDHIDSFFSIMRDVLENEKLKFDFYNLREILYCVVHKECGDYNLNKNELEVVKKFWNREYV